VNGVAVDGERRRDLAARPARDEQRGLREAVAGIEGAAPEARGRELLDEPRDRVVADRLGAAEENLHGREVESIALRIRDLADAEVVAKVRRSSDGAVVARYRL
jgi:hypothetical protein